MPSPYLLIADHASNHVPDDIDLGIAPELLHTHIAIDLGTADLGQALCSALGCPGIFADVSRLVIDLNREPDSPGLVPTCSDGHAIPGNADADIAARLARFHVPYHERIAAMIVGQQPALILSLHSFTPHLATRPAEARPWPIGILYNQDDRAARPAIAALRGLGLDVGDNQPYSGRDLNATMNRHAEANGIAYLGIEVRQDLLATAADIAQWAERLAHVIGVTLEAVSGG